MSITEFASLTDQQRRQILLDAWERRLDHGKNLTYNCTVIMRNHEITDQEQIGRIVWDGLKYEYRQWRLGDSHLTETSPFGLPSNTEARTSNRTSFAEKTGVWESATVSTTSKRKVGTVRNERNPITKYNLYSYWFDGEATTSGRCFFRELIDRKDSYVVEINAERNVVQLKVPWNSLKTKNTAGSITYILDPEKWFMPIESSGYWASSDGNGEPSQSPRVWNRESFKVLDSRLVGDVWMPIRIRQQLSTSSVNGQATVYDVEVTRIESGTVEPNDLKVDFSNASLVHDTTKGVLYSTDPDGDPIAQSIKPAFTKPVVSPSRSMTNYIVVGANAAAVVLFVAVRILASRRRGK